VKKTLFYMAFSLVFGLLAGGILFLISRPPRGKAIQLSPAPTAHLYVVQVSGAVEHPGVYELPTGSRVRDTVQAAGGLSSEASSMINLAAFVQDGEYIFIPAEGSSSPPAQRGDTLPVTIEAAPGAGSLGPVSGLININTASLEVLDQLPDIGPVIAQRIVDYRETNGPFASIEDIMKVQGIGQSTFDKLKNLIAVEP
jgi:competence protein ComEA